MLEPDGRAVLTEQLRPPAGFHLDRAVATTFTLDLTSALAVPLSFASHHLRESSNPIAILDAVRRASDRIDIFAQAGQLVVPAQASDLVAFLEPMMHPVVAPRPRALFHPKIWLLEYARGTDRQFRLLCASRNLTADRSWDVIARVDGEPTSQAHPMNEPLAVLVETLPDMAVVPLRPGRARRVREFAARLRRVSWESPSEASLTALHVFGIPGTPPPPPAELFDGKRHLVISPFLSDDGIGATVVSRSRESHVLSRRESIERLQPGTLRRLQTYALDDAINEGETEVASSLVGLHAKVYVLDRRDGGHLFIGSSNATGAAFGGNVEVLAEFVGPDTRIGVNAMFNDDAPLRQLAVEYSPPGGAETPADEQADHALEVEVRRLATARLRATVRAVDDRFSLDVERLDEAALDPRFTGHVHLLTRDGNHYALPGPAESFIIADLPLTDVSPFFVFTVTDERRESRSTIVSAELVGDIPGRRDAIIARQLSNRAAFLQLLALLLALDEGEVEAGLAGVSGFFGDWQGGGGAGLFETLIRAVGATHGGLADVKRIVDQLVKSGAMIGDDGEAILPEGFDELWAIVWSAHQLLVGTDAS